MRGTPTCAPQWSLSCACRRRTSPLSSAETCRGVVRGQPARQCRGPRLPPSVPLPQAQHACSGSGTDSRSNVDTSVSFRGRTCMGSGTRSNAADAGRHHKWCAGTRSRDCAPAVQAPFCLWAVGGTCQPRTCTAPSADFSSLASPRLLSLRLCPKAR